jgi:alkanesulfonate monooxygenase
MHFHWFLPSNGDGRSIANVVAREGVADGALTRPASVDYLGQVARGAEQSGFEAVLTPTGSGCEDAWILTSMLSQRTERLRFIVAFRPGFVAPTLAAHQAGSFQRLAGERLVVNIVSGGDPVEQRAYGDYLSHDERYQRTAEFLEVFRRSLRTAPFEFAGRHYRVERGAPASLDAAAPPIFFGGASPAALDVAARLADVHLSWGEPVDVLRRLVEDLTARAAAHGRELAFGVRLHVISRDTSAQAWAEADRLLAGMDPRAVAAAQERFARMDSVGQQRMTDLSAGGAERLRIAPNLWAGVGLIREGAGTALVGSHDEVADRLTEYADAGFDHVILSGWPHLEEAYRVGEQVLPRVRERLVAPLPAGLP